MMTLKRIVASLVAVLVAASPLLSMGSASAQTLSDNLAIDANEDQLSATLTYRGASVDVFGFAAPIYLDQGRLAISVIGPRVGQEVREIGRNSIGMVTQGAANKFDDLPGFWALHATPATAQPLAANGDDFDQLPDLLQDWAYKQIKVEPAGKALALALANKALKAQSNEGRLSIKNDVNFRTTGLFNTTLELPAYAPVGEYKITVHWLAADGTHLFSQSKTLVVSRGPIAEWIAYSSKNRALIYGLICVVVAVLGGLFSELVFRRLAP